MCLYLQCWKKNVLHTHAWEGLLQYWVCVSTCICTMYIFACLCVHLFNRLASTCKSCLLWITIVYVHVHVYIDNSKCWYCLDRGLAIAGWLAIAWGMHNYSPPASVDDGRIDGGCWLPVYTFDILFNTANKCYLRHIHLYTLTTGPSSSKGACCGC